MRIKNGCISEFGRVLGTTRAWHWPEAIGQMKRVLASATPSLLTLKLKCTLKKLSPRGFIPAEKQHTTLLILRQPIAVRLDQIVNQVPDLLQAQLGRCMRIEHGGVVDVLALAGEGGFDGQRLHVEVGLH